MGSHVGAGVDRRGRVCRPRERVPKESLSTVPVHSKHLKMLASVDILDI